MTEFQLVKHWWRELRLVGQPDVRKVRDREGC